MAKRSLSKKSGRNKGAYCVFVSHATADKWIATTFCEQIELCGAETFRDDRDIDGGDDIPSKIRKQIVRSSEILVLITPKSVNRPWVLLEVGAAWGRRQDARITAILCHVEVDMIPDIIQAKKAIDINNFGQYLKELRARVAKHNS